ncbi:RNA polymerase sigma factor [Pontibacillus litoralis]|uniref:RNA polymerase sigma-70 region 2 domain-containing protein n=1 Tax=Pontibacillus litoralis JSM 072002 TaxID=1385512 RepID=A0A0A5G5B9_9BACI|nr:sigma-70 family RNA polymerase sigma factor [Pontibacillus litoralis]KGX86353.1 hypothetical protein N784_05225 [Pontibacillus litoralis JSM 072002]
MTQLEYEQLVADYHPMIHRTIHRLGIMDPFGEFYQEGLLALWEVAQTYDEEKGKLSPYVYFIIRNRLISFIRSRNRKQAQTEEIMEKSRDEATVEMEIDAFDPFLYAHIQSVLTVNQMKWFNGFILQDLAVKDIARKEGVSINAVKNWARLAKQKLRSETVLLEYVGKTMEG